MLRSLNVKCDRTIKNQNIFKQYLVYVDVQRTCEKLENKQPIKSKYLSRLFSAVMNTNLNGYLNTFQKVAQLLCFQGNGICLHQMRFDMLCIVTSWWEKCP